ncbi:polysaccharide deacetylase family protein [Arhodomonas aquaeolei]|uniref:polysaccharide deacetylase family protein n=1 Tax=Arhodomonas aquaeolei TaxID=2369 RepID=UPI00216883C4|nr:polysaccharide deacetylase family protein [Arhodomonas aquaeolei]MCS4505802.1 polysaccharide deacetylase family protein [Arhodomonas aquaeolei]
MKGLIKRALVHTAAAPTVARLFSPLTTERATIFMLHRFEDPETGTPGHSPRALAELLGCLRRHGHAFLPLSEVFRRLADGRPALGNAVAFTMDDGFEDQLRVGLPVFRRFGCPVTVFLITDFVDGVLWPWDARIDYAFRNAARPGLELELGGRRLRCPLDTPEQRRFAVREVLAECKDMDGDHVEAVVAEVAERAGVRLPASPPAGYRPLTWSQAREAEAGGGVRFGPHGRTHRVLSRLSENEVRGEILGSWSRLTTELRAPLPVMCYPTGRTRDFGQRERRLLAANAFAGAVTAEPGYAEQGGSADARFAVGRFALPGNVADALQYCSYIETLKDRLLLRHSLSTH